MSDVQPRDILAYVGGHCLSRYGTITRRTTRIARGGEEERETFTRSGVASWVSGGAVLRPAASGIGRVSWEDLDGDGVRESPCLVSEVASSNLVAYSADFNSWTPSNSPVLTGGQADPMGGTAAFNIADTSASLNEFIQGAIASFTGNGVKAVSLFVKQGLTPYAGGSELFINDTTTHNNRLDATLTWAAGVPVLTMSVGTFIKSVQYTNGWWRIIMQTNSALLAASTNQFWIAPVVGAANQGDLYAFGAQAEDALIPTSHIPTTGSTGTRAIEKWTVPVSFDPQDLTVYWKIARPTLADVTGVLGGIFDIGDSSTNHLWGYLDSGSSTIYSAVQSGSQVSHNPATPAGTPLDAAVQLTGCATGPMVAQDYGSGLSGFTSAASSPLTAWANPRMQVAGISNSSARLNGALDRLIVAQGLHTLTEMRAIP